MNEEFLQNLNAHAHNRVQAARTLVRKSICAPESTSHIYGTINMGYTGAQISA